ncbi:MAG: type II toxin-antitoxin system RelE/ParE family toxin [Sinobacteraceae bacterium]|nr:type II toxin-antitoxin system RelE/ParE family toxin [Nevskiaceae bacterium]
MKLRWTRLALVDLHRAQEDIAQDNPVATNALALRVLEVAQGLPDNPLMGRPGQVTGTREWAVTGTPYLLVYRIKDDRVEILRLWHGARTGGILVPEAWRSRQNARDPLSSPP